MALIRIFDDGGRSAIEDLPNPGHPLGTPDAEGLESATGVVFVRRDRDSYPGFHNTPRRQYIIVLSGSLVFEVSGGERRSVGPGDVVLVEDTAGPGHITRGVADLAFVRLA
jgi:quercetin dioxygenase-like cupin family protein